MALVLDGDSGIVGVLATNADGDVIIDTNTFFVDAPNNRVGIGTLTPEQKLHVAGITKSNTGLMFGGTSSYLYESSADTVTLRVGSDGPYMRLGSNNGEIGNSSGATRLISGTGGSELVLTTSGNVGIGTASPAASLDLGSKTDAIILPSGTDAQQPSSPVTGSFRYNTDANAPEFRSPSAWISLGLKDGSSQQLAATSAQEIKDLTGTTVDGAYWIKPVGAGAAFQVHCYMSIENGGWMLALRNTSNELGPFSSGDFLVANWAGWAYNSKSQIDALGFNYSTAEDTNCFTPVYALSAFTDVMVIANRAGQQSKRVGWQHSGGFSSMYAAINDPSEKVATSVLFGNAYNWLSSLDVRSDTNIGDAANDRVGFKIRSDSGSTTNASNYTGGFWTSTMHYGSQIGCGRNNTTANVFGGGFGGNYSNSRWHRNNGHWWNHGDGRSSSAWNASDQSSAFYGHAVYIR